MGDEVIEQVAADQLHRAKRWYSGFIAGSLGPGIVWETMVNTDLPLHQEHNEMAQKYYGKKAFIYVDPGETGDQALVKFANQLLLGFPQYTHAERAEWVVGFMDGVLSSAKWSGLR